MPTVKSPSGLENWNYYVGAQGEFRWSSNDAVIPPSCWQEASPMLRLELPPMPSSQQEAYDREISASIAEYVAERDKRGYSEEELFEMRAAFGAGETVVDVLTGKKIKL